MGTPLGPKCIPFTYMDPLGNLVKQAPTLPTGGSLGYLVSEVAFRVYLDPKSM